MGGGGKETPRQKMIGMMYLVLTALLAMNVSKDILNAFVAVDDSLIKTNQNFAAKNEAIDQAFKLADIDNHKKTGPYYDIAKEISKEAKDLDEYIKHIKVELIMHVEKVPENVADTMKLAKLTGKDNYNEPTHYLIGDNEEHATGEAKNLREKIEKFREFLTSKLKGVVKKPGAYAAFEKGLGLKTGKTYSAFEEKEVEWENNLFYHTPLAADITHLSQIQNDVRNTEGDALKILYDEITASDFKFDTLSAKVIAASNYVLSGTEYTADVFVAAFSTTQNPQVWLGQVDTVTNTIKGNIDSTSVKVSRGIGKYTMHTGADGLQKWSGLIRVKSPTGTIKSYPFKSEYMVAKPAASVSPQKMNVMYIGVDNPIAISAAGVAPTDIHPTITGCGGSMKPSGKPGEYIVTVSSVGTANIVVNATVNGKNTPQGTFPFRVKRVPPPVAFFGTKKGDDKMSKAELTSILGVSAKLENFDFELKFDIVSFDISMSVGSNIVTESSKSNRVTPAQSTMLKNAKTGGKVYIENVKAKGPDGSVVSIPGVNLKIN